MLRLTALALALTGCAGPSSETADSADSDAPAVAYTGCLADGLTVDAATGTTAPVPLVDGDTVRLVHGPQGGWHIDVAGLVSNTEQNVAISARFTDLQTQNVVAGLNQQPTNQALVAWSEDGCSGDFYAVRTYVDDLAPSVSLADICDLDGAILRFELTVTALEADPQPSVTTCVDVVAALDPEDVEACAAL